MTTFQHSPEDAGLLELRRQNGSLVTAYRYDHFNFHPHCHPVKLPESAGGKELTMVLPADHPWHSGMCFAWKYLNGCNVWDFDATGTKSGRLAHRDIRIAPASSTLTHTLVWQDDTGTDLIEDQRTLCVSENLEGLPVFDWHFHFTALAPEVICERHLEWGGYGGFYVRFARGTDPQLLNAEGTRNMEEEERFRSRWCAYSFAMDGLPSRGFFNNHAGMAIFDHPNNLRHPTPWLTYNRMNMQKIMPAFLRDAPFVFKKGDTLDLQYRAISFLGKPDQVRIDAAWQQWADQPAISAVEKQK